MKLEPTSDGFTIEANDLAPLLEIAADEVHALMRAGQITSLVEKGEGADEGRYRVTFRHGNVRLRFVVDAAGNVISRSRVGTTSR